MRECEYCGRDDSTLFAWHGDVWCADCLGVQHAETPELAPLEGTVADAPLGRPDVADPARPYVWRTVNGRVFLGRLEHGDAAQHDMPGPHGARDG